jgi:uncharacterized protein YjbI with pentapeptide repeats
MRFQKVSHDKVLETTARIEYSYNDIITNKIYDIPSNTLWDKIRCDTQHHIALISTTIESIVYNGLSFINVQFEDCVLSHVLFKNCIFINCEFNKCNVDNVIFLNSYFLELSVVETRLDTCTFKNTKFKKVCIRFSSSYETRLNNVKVYSLDLLDSSISSDLKVSKNVTLKNIKLNGLQLDYNQYDLKTITLDDKGTLNVSKQ